MAVVNQNLETKANIEIYLIAPLKILERIDQRAESLSNPIARWKLEVEIPANSENRYFQIPLNAMLRQVVLVTPDLEGAATVKLQIINQDRALLFESSAVNGNQKTALFTTEQIPVAEVCTMNILLSDVQASSKTFSVILYGI